MDQPQFDGTEEEIPLSFEECPADEPKTTPDPAPVPAGIEALTPVLQGLMQQNQLLAQQVEALTQRFQTLQQNAPATPPTAATPTWLEGLDENDPYAPVFNRQAQHASALEQRLAQVVAQNEKLSMMVQNTLADQAMGKLESKFTKALEQAGVMPEFMDNYKQQLWALHSTSNGQVDVAAAARHIKDTEQRALGGYTKRLVQEARKPKPRQLPKGIALDDTGMPNPQTPEEFKAMDKFITDYFDSQN